NTLTIEAKRRLLVAAQTALLPDPPAEVSKTTTVDLLNRIRRPDGDPDKITAIGPIIQAYNDGNLSKADFALVQKQLADTATPDNEIPTEDRQAYVDRAAPL